MIKKSAEITGNVLHDFKGGSGKITLFGFMDEKEANGAGRLFAKTVIEPGCSVGEHTHEGDMEAYYFLKGKALVSDNGTDVILEAGDCHICADGQSHSIKNAGGDTLEYIAIVLHTKQKEVC
ncbi:MAG: cupin domain-containing protein [Oscillospiraceae bacterium]|nr:cupin domain-containing protein [Oscillospiraceae bacterium]